MNREEYLRMIIYTNLANININPGDFILTAYEVVAHENITPQFKANVIKTFNDNIDENKLKFPENVMAVLAKYYFANDNNITSREKELLEMLLIKAKYINIYAPETLYDFMKTLTLITTGEKVSEQFLQLLLKVGDMTKSFIELNDTV